MESCKWTVHDPDRPTERGRKAFQSSSLCAISAASRDNESSRIKRRPMLWRKEFHQRAITIAQTLVGSDKRGDFSLIHAALNRRSRAHLRWSPSPPHARAVSSSFTLEIRRVNSRGPCITESGRKQRNERERNRMRTHAISSFNILSCFSFTEVLRRFMLILVHSSRLKINRADRIKNRYMHWCRPATMRAADLCRWLLPRIAKRTINCDGNGKYPFHFFGKPCVKWLSRISLSEKRGIEHFSLKNEVPREVEREIENTVRRHRTFRVRVLHFRASVIKSVRYRGSHERKSVFWEWNATTHLYACSFCSLSQNLQLSSFLFFFFFINYMNAWWANYW